MEGPESVDNEKNSEEGKKKRNRIDPKKVVIGKKKPVPKVEENEDIGVGGLFDDDEKKYNDAEPTEEEILAAIKASEDPEVVNNDEVEKTEEISTSDEIDQDENTSK